MVYRILFAGFLFLATFEGLANVTYADFNNSSNTIKTANGESFNVRRVLSYDHSSKTAGVVIDAKDRFGNVVQQNKQLKIDANKFKSWTLACVRFGPACGAYAAITAAFVVGSFYFDEEIQQFISTAISKIWKPSADTCPASLIRIGTINHRKIECFTVLSTNTTFDTLEPKPELLEWSRGQVTIMPATFVTTDGVTSAGQQAYYRYRRTDSPASVPDVVIGTKTQAQPSDIVERLASNPAVWQLSPGVFPDIFESPSVSENPALDPESVPQEPIVGGQPTNADLIDMSSVPTFTFDVSEHLDHESFLPAECPAPISFDIANTVFEMNFDIVCNFANMIRPFIVFTGLIMWLVIVWRGLSL